MKWFFYKFFMRDKNILKDNDQQKCVYKLLEDIGTGVPRYIWLKKSVNNQLDQYAHLLCHIFALKDSSDYS